MSLDKSIASGKEKRKPYHGAGRTDPTCRPHGSCPYCANNRRHPQRKAARGAAEQLQELSVAEDLTRRELAETEWEACFADEQSEHVAHDEFIRNDYEAYAKIAERIEKESDGILATETYLFEDP